MQKLKNLAGYIPEAMHLQEGPDIRSRIFATYLLTFSASNVCYRFAGDCFMRGCDTRVAQIKKVVVLMAYFVLSDH